MSSKKRSSSSSKSTPSRTTIKKTKPTYISIWDRISRLKKDINQNYNEIWELGQEVQRTRDKDTILKLHRKMGDLKGITKIKENDLVDLVIESNKLIGKDRKNLISVLRELEIDPYCQWSGQPDDFLIVIDNNRTNLPDLEGEDLSGVVGGVELDSDNSIHIYCEMELPIDHQLEIKELHNIKNKINRYLKKNPNINVTVIIDRDDMKYPNHIAIHQDIIRNVGTSEREKFMFYSELSDIIKGLLHQLNTINERL
jgi:hypothetical protein